MNESKQIDNKHLFKEWRRKRFQSKLKMINSCKMLMTKPLASSQEGEMNKQVNEAIKHK